MTEDEYRIIPIDLPLRVEGMVAYDADGYPTIYVNSRLTRERQRIAAKHEIDHIEHDDAYSDEDIRAVEHRAGMVG